MQLLQPVLRVENVVHRTGWILDHVGNFSPWRTKIPTVCVILSCPHLKQRMRRLFLLAALNQGQLKLSKLTDKENLFSSRGNNISVPFFLAL